MVMELDTNHLIDLEGDVVYRTVNQLEASSLDGHVVISSCSTDCP